MDEKLEMFREQSKVCAFCGKKSMINGMSVPLVSLSESGKVITPYDSKGTSSAVMYPACAYHFVLIGEGLMAVTTQDQVILPNILQELEPKSDEELKNLSMKLRRINSKEKANKFLLTVVKTILEGRKFEKDFEERLKDGKQSVQNSGNKEPDENKLPSSDGPAGPKE